MATEVTQATELAQVTQTLKWLDEERRKDRATITALQERIQGQEQQLAQQAAQAQELQIALASVQGVMSKVTGFEQMVSNFKGELIAQMEQRDETRRKEQAEAERLRRIEYQALTEGLNRLEKTTRVLPRYDEELNARRVEDQRLFEAIQRLEAAEADLSKRSDDRVQGVVYLEEQRRADNRRIADLEHDTTELHKRIEALAVKFPLLEEALQKQRPRIEEAIQETKKYAKPIEELRVSDFQREQKMKQYLDQGGAGGPGTGAGAGTGTGIPRTTATGQARRWRSWSASRRAWRSGRTKWPRCSGWPRTGSSGSGRSGRGSRTSNRRSGRCWSRSAGGNKGRPTPSIRNGWMHCRRPPTCTSAQLDTFWEARRSDAIRVLQNTQAGYEAAIAQINTQLSILRGEQ